MKNLIVIIFCALLAMGLQAQNQFHVFPKTHALTPGASTGNGSIQHPWDLQTALQQTPEVVNGGDIIWVHGGIYNGRFVSDLKSTIKDAFITVVAAPNSRVVLNGNVDSSQPETLKVTGDRVIYKDFEITWLGDFVRNTSDTNFKRVTAGINHVTGKDCKFINLKIYNNPGLGFGSWKRTGGTEIRECMVFNNGVLKPKGKGGGEGLYIQNETEDERIIKDNIIFNNYYKGIEVWSAGKKVNKAYVKHITLDNNVVFNSGLLARKVDNIIVASNDRNAINIAKNITVKNNILYHNTNFNKNEVNGDAASLTLGFYHKAPVEDVTVKNNIILGRNNALRLLHVKSMSFVDNIIYTGYVQLAKSTLQYINPKNWKLSNNTFYTKNKTPYIVMPKEKLNAKTWNSKYPVQTNTVTKSISEFNLTPVLNITQSSYNSHRFRVVLFSKTMEDVSVDFSNYPQYLGKTYTVKDVERLDEVVLSGTLHQNQIVVPMTKTNRKPTETLNNFGVFIIEFSNAEQQSVEKKRPKTFFGRLFSWLF